MVYKTNKCRRGDVPIFLLIAYWFLTVVRCHNSCHNKVRGAEQNIFLVKWEGWKQIEVLYWLSVSLETLIFYDG